MRALSLISLALAASCGGAPAERPGTPPEHVLLVTVENLRADHTHLWQYPRPTTFIERSDDQRSLDLDFLMERGVLFHQAFSPSGAARPALATLFTGLPPRAHGLTTAGGALAEDVSTLAERLRDAGYQTAGFASPSRPMADSALTHPQAPKPAQAYSRATSVSRRYGVRRTISCYLRRRRHKRRRSMRPQRTKQAREL